MPPPGQVDFSATFFLFSPMAIFALDSRLIFPPVTASQPDGLLALGGDLSPERLMLAYRSGIFPWYEGQYILWWSPDPRFVLFPESLRISKSMQALLRKDAFVFTRNLAFREVISHCKSARRQGQQGTWITEEMKKAYIRLHELGHAHSAEVWQDGKLVGGLYGIRMGHVFCGESMFSLVSNASKYAFIRYVEQLREESVRLIDCQVYTDHLASLGAELIPRSKFMELLQQYKN